MSLRDELEKIFSKTPTRQMEVQRQMRAVSDEAQGLMRQQRTLQHMQGEPVRQQIASIRAGTDAPSAGLMDTVRGSMVGRGLAEGIGNVIGSPAEIDAQRRASEQAEQQAQFILSQMQRDDITDEQRQRLFEILRQQQAGMGTQTRRFSQQLDETTGRGAQRAALAGGAELGLLASTGLASRLAGTSTLRQGLQTGQRARGTVTRGAGMTQLRGQQLAGRAGRAGTVLGAEGAAFGATTAMQDPNMTREGLMRSVGQGTLFGAGVGAAIPGVAAGVGVRRAARARDAEQRTQAINASNQELGIRGSKVDAGPMNRLNDMVRRGVGKVIEPIQSTTVGAKTRQFLNRAQENLQRTEAPIMRALRDGERKGVLPQGFSRRVETLIRDVKTSTRQAEAFTDPRYADRLTATNISGAEEWQRVIAGQGGRAINKKQLSDLNRYIEAKAELNLMQVDPRTASASRRRQFQAVVNELESEDFAQRYSAMIDYNRKLGEVMVEGGLITRQQLNQWRKTNQEYIRIQRVVDDLSQRGGIAGGGGGASIRSTTATQRRMGSTRQMREPVQTQLERTSQIMREVLRNRAANEMIDGLKRLGPDFADPVRTAENVLARADLQEALALSRPLKKALQRATVSQGRYVRRIQQELATLNRQGLRESLRRQGLDDTLAGKLVDPSQQMTAAETRNVVEALLGSTDSSQLRRIRQKIARRDPKLSQAIDELENVRDELTKVNRQRSQEYQELLSLADDKIRNQPTVARRVNGIDEVYTTLPEIEAAAKVWGRAPITAVGRIFATPVRFLRATLTGALNPAFALRSLVRDGVESFNLSRNAMATHDPRNVMRAVAEAAGQDDLFRRFMATDGSNTFIDYLRKPRQATREIMRQSRLQLPPVQRRAQIIRNPADWYRTMEDVSRWQELLGRYQNFRGAYNDAIKRGMGEADALIEARWAARNNQVDFFQTGNWSHVLNSFFPYFNSTIQGGSRIGRALKEKPVTTSAKIAASIQVPTVLAAMYNMSDPRRAQIYLDMPEWERDNNWIFVLPGTEKTDGRWNVVKIPKPPGVGNFSEPIERMTVAMYGHDPVEFQNFVNGFTKGFGSPIDFSSRSAMVGSIIPQQIKPFVQSAANYDFFTEREIVPQWLADQNPEPFRQHFDSTSTTARSLGRLLDMSPLTVEKFLQDTAGEFGRNALFYFDTAAESMGLGEGEVGGRSHAESLRRVFTTASGGMENVRAREKITAVFDDRQPTSNRVTELINEGKIDEASDLARQFNQDIDDLLAMIAERGEEFVRASDAQIEAMERMRFPMDGDRLSDRSISARQRQ